jgi:hypothetical protein
LKTSLKLFIGFVLVQILLVPRNVSGQYFVAGQDPGGIKWRQIQTEHFQILYPSDYEAEGHRVAHIFEKVYGYSGVTLSHHPRKITIILHAKSMKSNGFVAWSPSRIELFPTPGQDSYAQEWIEQLATHELRHHVQIDKIESELPAIFKILLGEQAASIVIGAYLPFWFLEGDAVVTETALSSSGRGRVPSFTMELKAQADEKGIYSFDKAYLGSYKDYIPDYYQLGYQMVSNIRNKNGGEVWGKVLHHIAKNPLGVNSLSKGLKLATGKNQDEHYREIMYNLKNTNPFRLNIPEDTVLSGRRMVGSSKEYISYRYPHLLNDSSIVALKSSLGKIQELVLIDKNLNERKLFEPGFILEESLSVSNGKIVWFESKPDLRWTHRDRTLLRILDIQSGTLVDKVFSEKLYAPMFSPDGKWISAVALDNLNHSSIDLISVDNYLIKKVFMAYPNHYFITPSWSKDGSSMYAVDLGDKGKSIVKLNLANGKKNNITVPISGEIKKPFQWNNFLIYSANQSGKFQGFAIDLTTNKQYLIATAKYGIKDLQCSGNSNTLIFADYAANGFKIATKTVNSDVWKEIDQKSWFQDTLANKLTAQEKGAIDFSKQDTNQYTSQKYVKFLNLINIHSWSPAYVDPDNSTVNIGFSVISQNKLTTAITQFGYNYSSVNQAGKWVGKFEYSGWYPILRIYGDYGKEKSQYYQINRHYNTNNVLISQDTVAVPYSKKVLNTHFDALIPFNFSKGKMYRMVEPEIQIGYSHYWQDPATPSTIFRGSYIPFSYRLYLHNIMQQSTRDIQARWGQIVDLQFRHTPFGDKRLGNIVSTEGTFFFPGILCNQGIRVYTGYQLKKSASSYFNDLIYYPRGYTNVDNNELKTLRSDYVLPLLSPDWHIWHLYYLKRITMRLFYDYAQISIPIHQTTNTINKTLSSFGGELVTECHLLRFIAPFKLGVRESYLTESGQFSSEFLLSVNLKGM